MKSYLSEIVFNAIAPFFLVLIKTPYDGAGTPMQGESGFREGRSPLSNSF